MGETQVARDINPPARPLYKESQYWKNLNEHSPFSSKIIDSAKADAQHFEMTKTLTARE